MRENACGVHASKKRTDKVADEGVVEVLHNAMEEAQHREHEALFVVVFTNL